MAKLNRFDFDEMTIFSSLIKFIRNNRFAKKNYWCAQTLVNVPIKIDSKHLRPIDIYDDFRSGSNASRKPKSNTKL